MGEIRKSTSERREHLRLKSLNLISYINKEEGALKTNISMARTLDISPAGIKVEVYRMINEGSLMEMEIAIKETIISAEGKVIYSQKASDSTFIIGIKFEKYQKTIENL